MTKKIGIIFLFVTALFLLLGNFPRADFFTGSMGSGNLSELVLYAFAFGCSFLVYDKLLNCNLFLILTTGVFVSLVIGLIKWGVDSTAIAYNVRLMLQILSSTLIGFFLYGRYADHVGDVVKLYLFLFAWIVALSYVIFFIFPDTGLLLAALSSSGIEFRGDPHVGRLISPYLDPNYFSIIIVLPIFMALDLFRRKPSWIKGIFVAFLFGALVLTLSRSGWSLFVLLAVFLALSKGMKFLQFVKSAQYNVKRTTLYSGIALLFVLIISSAIMAPLYSTMSKRFENIGSDDSALARLDSFYIGMELLANEPLLGYGYNFSVKPIIAIRGIGEPGLDSSLQGVLVNFGILPTIFLTFALVIWLFNTNSVLKKYGKTSDVYSMWRLTISYILLSIIWAGNFNPVLLYTFWLVPNLSLLMYFGFIAYGRIRLEINQKRDSNVLLSRKII